MHHSRILTPAVALLSLSIVCCTTQPVVLNEIAQPPASSRLRVFVQPLESSSKWQIPYSTYAEASLEGISKVWFDTGIYEVVPPGDVDAVAGTARRSMTWKADNYDLARRVASALWAEYAMLVERIESNRQYYYSTTLISVRTGAVFKVMMHVPGGTRSDYQPIIRATYKQLFTDAREDMIATARSKRDSASGTRVEDSGRPMARPTEISRSLNIATLARQSGAQGSRVPVAVYDVDAREEDRLLSKILSEAFRAELVALGRFQLVSREALDRILEELSLQLSGILDESQAARVGQGVAAQQIIVGFYGTVGSMSVIQVKRIDVETQKTVGVGSLSCQTGKEEELLYGMAGLAASVSTDS